MKKENMFVLFCVLNCTPFISLAQTPAHEPHYHLIWEDNFNTLNTNIWLVKDNFESNSGKKIFIQEKVSDFTVPIGAEIYFDVNPFY